MFRPFIALLFCATLASAEDGGASFDVKAKVQRANVVLRALGPSLKCRDWVERKQASCRKTISTPQDPMAPMLCENQYKTYAYNCEHLSLANLRKAGEENAGDEVLKRQLQEMGSERRFPAFLHDGKTYVGEEFLSCMESAFSSTYLAETAKACREAWEEDASGSAQCAGEKASDYYRHAMKCGDAALVASQAGPSDNSKEEAAKKPKKKTK